MQAFPRCSCPLAENTISIKKAKYLQEFLFNNFAPKHTNYSAMVGPNQKCFFFCPQRHELSFMVVYHLYRSMRFLRKKIVEHFILATLLYIIDERPKWTCDTFLEKWLNRFEFFWYKIESMNVLRVNYGLDFALSPRGPCPRPFWLQKLVASKFCHLGVKKGN